MFICMYASLSLNSEDMQIYPVTMYIKRRTDTRRKLEERRDIDYVHCGMFPFVLVQGHCQSMSFQTIGYFTTIVLIIGLFPSLHCF